MTGVFDLVRFNPGATARGLDATAEQLNHDRLVGRLKGMMDRHAHRVVRHPWRSTLERRDGTHSKRPPVLRPVEALCQSAMDVTQLKKSGCSP